MALDYTDSLASIRILIGDTATPYDLADGTITNVIDRQSHSVFQSSLVKAHSSGKVYRALTGNWLEATIYDADDVEVSPSTSNLTKGFWKFSTEQDTLYIDGTFTNIYLASAECITVLIAKLRSEYDFSTEEGTFNRNQRIETLKEMRTMYLQQSVAYSVGNDYPAKGEMVY